MNAPNANRVDIYAPANAQGWRPWGLAALVLAVVLIAAPTIALTLVLHRFGLVDNNAEPVGAGGFMAFLVFPFALIALLALAWVKLVERRPLASIGIGGRGWLTRLAGGWLLGLVMAAGVVAAIAIVGGFSLGAIAPALNDPGAFMLIVALAFAFAVQSGAEELVFRGWLMSALAWRWGVIAAVVGSSLLFTLLHFDPAHHWVMNANMFAFSIFASALVLRARGVGIAVGWHAAWNWLLAVGFETPITGIDADLPALIVATTPTGPAELHGVGAGPEGSAIATIVFVAGTVLLLVWRVREARRRAELAATTNPQ